jgi:hypothetical protein
MHAAGRSVGFSALSTERFDLDRGRFQTKAERPCTFEQPLIEHGVLDLSDPPALPTDQELTCVLVFRSITPQERIERVEAMHEPGLLQELECSIDGGRRSLFPTPGKLGKNLVGADWLVLSPYDLKNMPAQGGEVDLLRCTDPLGGCDRAPHASRVIVRHSLPL